MRLAHERLFGVGPATWLVQSVLVQREHPAKPAAAVDEHCRQLTRLVKVGRVDGHLRGDVDHGVPE
jgi:hypothetical protein